MQIPVRSSSKFGMSEYLLFCPIKRPYYDFWLCVMGQSHVNTLGVLSLRFSQNFRISLQYNLLDFEDWCFICWLINVIWKEWAKKGKIKALFFCPHCTSTYEQKHDALFTATVNQYAVQSAWRSSRYYAQ